MTLGAANKCIVEHAGLQAQGAFCVKPMPKVRQALSFCTSGLFGEREATKKLEYSNSDDFRKLSVYTGPNLSVSYKRNACIIK